MNNEKNKSVELPFETGKTFVKDKAIGRPWHKPCVKRIDMKMTAQRAASATDGTTTAKL